MASYPTSIDSLTNPSAGDKLNSPAHAAQHTDANDIIEALMAKVGADSSAVNSSHDYKLSTITSTAKAVSTAGNQTVAGNKTFSGTTTTSGALTISGTAAFADTATFNGVPTFNTRAIFGAAVKQKLVTETDGATITFDLNDANIQTVVMEGDRILALANASVGQVFILILVQDGTGTRVPTFFSTIKWADGTAPTLTTTLNKADIFGFICYSAGNYYGVTIDQNL